MSAVAAAGEAAESDVLVFGFDDRGPQTVSLAGLAEVLPAKTLDGLVGCPRATADVAPNFRIRLHRDEGRLVPALMRPEDELVRFEENRTFRGGHARPFRATKIAALSGAVNGYIGGTTPSLPTLTRTDESVRLAPRVATT